MFRVTLTLPSETSLSHLRKSSDAGGVDGSEPSRSGQAKAGTPSLRFMEVVLFFLLSVRLFFATGHTNDFSAVQVACAFVGFEEFSFKISGLLVFLNTFAGQILVCISLPLLLGFRFLFFSSPPVLSPTSSSSSTDISIIRPVPSASSLTGLLSKRKGGTSSSPATAPVTPPSSLDSPLLSSSGSQCAAHKTTECQKFLCQLGIAMLWLCLLHTLRCTMTTINVTIQRRHLMVWAIFAPKYVFDIAHLLVTDLCLLLLYILLLRFVAVAETAFHGDRYQPSKVISF
eukprot:TRINITY_DN10646_c0_g1_i11.p1 TRINITY_DN10646_c0_g1~~TRINITY_DN10646_c0_g1_i11.p1  ORF type:complete len:286 (-),score=85.95 TRINITY_DN10646_c0_g1_i11:278-1135(-)